MDSFNAKDYNVEVTKLIPMGDDTCHFRIWKKKGVKKTFGEPVLEFSQKGKFEKERNIFCALSAYPILFTIRSPFLQCHSSSLYR